MSPQTIPVIYQRERIKWDFSEYQQEKAWADLELAEQQFYDDLDITKEGREVKETMDKLGITL